MDINSVKKSYKRWAPVYDKTFGVATTAGRRRAAEYINARGGRVLEVGVGTGLALRHYGAHVSVTGIDASAEMLAKARAKITEHKLGNVEDLQQMDARSLTFPDDHFDSVVAMHIVSVVPEPERVIAEMARVCKPGGSLVITNHFAGEKGVMSRLERLAAPFADILGWHSDFPIERVLGEERLAMRERRSLPPLGMMTFLVLEKTRAA